MEFFKNLLKNITRDENLTITPLKAILCSGGKIKKKQAEKLLQSWTQSGYFKKHIDNQIHLGPKLLCEFRELLQSLELNYLRSCLLCESIAIWVSSNWFWSTFLASSQALFYTGRTLPHLHHTFPQVVHSKVHSPDQEMP